MRAKIKAIDDYCNERLEVGRKKYGEDAWKTRDTIEDMIEELADMANYAKFMIMKLHLMQKRVKAIEQVCDLFKEDDTIVHSEDKEA